MDYFLDKMVIKDKIKFEDIMSWIVIGLMVATVIWILSGSPTEMGAIIGIFGFTATSEILLWKKLFSIENDFNSRLLKLDKKTEISFINLRNDMNKGFDKIGNKLNIIESKIK